MSIVLFFIQLLKQSKGSMGCSLKNDTTLLKRPQQCSICRMEFTTLATVSQFKQHLNNCNRPFQPLRFVQQQYPVSNRIDTINNQAQPTQPDRQFVSNNLITSNLTQLVDSVQTQKFFWNKELIPNQKLKYQWVKKPIFPHLYDQDQILEMDNHAMKHKEFPLKQFWFRLQMERLRIPFSSGSDVLFVEKDNIRLSSLKSIKDVNWLKEIKIVIAGEEALDAGGLLREWFTLVMKDLINPSSGMFQFADTQDITYKINFNNTDQVDQHKIDCFELLGIVVGKSIIEHVPLNVYFDRSILRHILGQSVILEDIYHYDESLYNSWNYLLSNQFNPEALMLYFEITYQDRVHLLKPFGDQIIVTSENISEYIQLCINYYTHLAVQPFLDSFLKQLYSIIPKELICVFEPLEMEMLLYGMPQVNLDDWKQYTEYKEPFHEKHQTIIWFWEYLATMDLPKLGQCLQFCTGTQRTPVEGFRNLQSNRGKNAKFNIVSSTQTKGFPKAHTCFNRLELPIYESYKDLETYLSVITSVDFEGVFGME